MNTSPSTYFFISYSREDKKLQERVVRELRERGVNVWVDIENLIPGSPAWEREIERSIRNCTGIIVLLSPNSNNSEWVRREISFAEEHDRHIFPVHIHGDENDSIPLRLSAHQRVDLRKNMEKGLDHLADTLKVFSGTPPADKAEIEERKAFDLSVLISSLNTRTALFTAIGLIVIGGLFTLGKGLFTNNNLTPGDLTTPVDTDPIITETSEPTDEPTGKIVYTCNIQGNEICIINADGSGWQQLTNNNFANFNASLSPDGQKALYVISNGNYSEIHELDIATGTSTQMTDLVNNIGSPEISPDNQFIVFHYLLGKSNLQLWIMNRDGSDPHEFYSEPGRDLHDATWSPDGTQLLFALGKGANNKLYIMDFNGREPRLLNESIDTRGRSDWGVNDLITLDMGGSWAHEVYTMSSEGRNLRQVSPTGMNSQGASLSPDGKWIAYTAYTNVADKDAASCEIFIMRMDGTDIRQLTNNNYCDYQPRWGN